MKSPIDCLGRTWLHRSLDAAKDCKGNCLPWCQNDDLLDDLHTLGDINAQDILGRSVLLLACEKGCVDLVETLIELNARSELKTRLGTTALHHAAIKGHHKICELLIERLHADVDAVDTDDDCTALHYALQKEHVDVARVLLKNGADPNEENHNNWTPFMVAAWRDNLDLIKLFEVITSVDINAGAHDSTGTALHLTIASDNSIECLKYLCSRQGINLNARDLRDETPLMVSSPERKCYSSGISSQHPECRH
jgi:ankyrin repeat protein